MKQLWNNGWSFLKTEAGTGREEILDRMQEFEAVSLPHDWLIYDAQNLYEHGTGWYRKQFFCEDPSKARTVLYFEGIYMDSTIYINGAEAAQWKYGYSSFWIDVTDYLQQGENEVLISVCFRSPNSRWYSGAGIYRNVWFITTEKTYLAQHGIYISTEKQEDGFLLRVETEVCGEQADEAVICHRLTDGIGREIALELTAEEGKRKEYKVTDVELWDVEHPALYFLHTALVLDGTVLQEETERFGFRYMKFTPDQGFFLNGRHLKINGSCEHHDLGALGAVFNKAAMKRRFEILQNMGVNAVRGAHNMMAPEALELADEMGILIISEAFDMWERSKTTYDYARFFPEWAPKDVENWVKRDRNHPCVFMWSIGNEIYDTHAGERGQELTRYLKDLTEQYDPYKNAVVTMGSNYMPWENARKCADIVKVIGYNYAEKYYKSHHEEHPDWVIYGSETCSIVQSRGVYHFPLSTGILADDDEQCSALGNSITSWGAKSLEDCIAMDRDMEFSMGQFIWSGFDYIGEPTPYHTKNAYLGHIDTAGFPKDSYYVWQSAWTDYRKAPMIHVFPYWDFNEGQLIDVRVCSNAPFVELYLNGKSLGRQHLTHEIGSGNHLIADYQVPYEKGTLLAVAYDEEGREVIREEKKSFGNSAQIVIYPENETVQADGRDLLFLEIGTLDAEGNPVENACDRVQVDVTGAGRLVGLDNGDSTDYDQYKGTCRRLFNGKLLAMIQADMEPGEILVKVSGRDLKPAEMVFRCAALERDGEKSATGEMKLVRAADGADQTGVAVSVIRKVNLTGVSLPPANTDRAINLGHRDEIPVRRISLTAPEGRTFSKEKRELRAQAAIEPANADDQKLVFEAVNAKGVASNLVILKQEGNQAFMTALGDGEFYLRCKSKSGSDKVRVISQLEFTVQGLGQAYQDPYGFISGSSYTSFQGEVGNGNERGAATARDGETVVSYGNIDFGPVGSDEITVPIFALTSEEYPIQIWEGIPGQDGSELLAEVVYQKPTIWNTYQPETWKLKKRLTGITTVSFAVHQKIHLKGFSFTRYEKAWMQLPAGSTDAIYGDSFERTERGVESIGNNVSLLYDEMDFGSEGLTELTICGRAVKGSNTIHVRFFNGEEEIKQIVEFAQSEEWEEQSFRLDRVCGKWDVSFVFLPGSCFDFAWFRFEK